MSERLDVLVRGGVVVSPWGVVEADVGIADGLIRYVGHSNGRTQVDEVIDATGLHVLPGIIDPHVHMINAGKSVAQFCAEDMRSQVAGGVTACLSFIYSYDSYVPLVEASRDAVESGALIDVGFHQILMKPVHLAEMAQCRERYGITSFKMFFAAGDEELYPGTMPVDDGFLFAALRAIPRLGGDALAMVHAENWEIGRMLEEELRAAGRDDPAAWTDSHPAICEEDGMRRAIFLATSLGCPLYIVHATTAATGPLVRGAQAADACVIAETCPHYLTIDKTHPLALAAKYSPAVKEREDVEALWDGIRRGWISSIGSDHIPVTRADKSLDGKDIWTARGGAPGSGTILSIMLSEGVNKGRIPIERVAQVCAHGPAKAFGLRGKGLIAPGNDADLVLVDLNRTMTMTPELLHCDYVLYDGWEMTGWPTLTMVRGHVVMCDGEIVGRPGTGRYLYR